MLSKRQKRIDEAIERDDWPAARRGLAANLRENPKDHWSLARLALTYYEERDYETALKASQQAMQIRPACWLARWEYAGALEMTGTGEEAIAIWQGLVDQGTKSIARSTCGEGRESARSLIADCKWRLAMAFADRGDFPAALRYMRLYLKDCDKGATSIYDRTLAESDLAKWQI